MRRLALGLFCAASLAAQAMAQDRILHVGLREDPDLLDPTLGSSYVGRIVFSGICDKLFDIDAKLNIVPVLATGYEWKDPTHLVIHIRDGVQFQDGEKLNAEAVKYKLTRDLNAKGSMRRGEISSVDSIDVIDPLTVQLNLKAPAVAASGAAHRPRRHHDLAQGDRGGGRQVRPASGLRRAIQFRLAVSRRTASW